jgi:hypothetical protein
MTKHQNFTKTPLNRELIFEGCRILAARGIHPTVSNLYGYFGMSGSKSTLSKHLKNWRMEEGQNDYREPPPIPDSIASFLDDARESVWALCFQQISRIYQIEIDQLTETNAALQDQNQRLEDRCADRDELLIKIGKLEAKLESVAVKPDNKREAIVAASRKTEASMEDSDQLSFLPNDAAS